MLDAANLRLGEILNASCKNFIIPFIIIAVQKKSKKAFLKS